MQLPEKYKVGVTSEGPSLETSKFSLYFSGSCIPTNDSLFINYYWHCLHDALFKYFKLTHSATIKLHFTAELFLECMHVLWFEKACMLVRNRLNDVTNMIKHLISLH